VGPHPAVAATRLAVRRCLVGESGLADRAVRKLGAGDLVLVACSGGADSLALATALAFEAPKAGLRAGGVVIDHGLQPGSGEVAESVVATMTSLGLDPALKVAVVVPRQGDPGGYQGPEAAARSARYAALDTAAESAGAAAVMLGHTLDDQAETVLLGLARGSGARSLAGMPGRSGRYLRPLLGLRRAQTREACAALGLEPWEDPQNCDPAFTRSRVRHELLPVLEATLGPGVTEALARTARLLRADTDALDELAAGVAARVSRQTGPDDDGWPVAELAAQPAALRRRILRMGALAAGCPGGALSERHITSMDELMTSWRGQRWTDLPGGIRCQRRYGRLHFTADIAAPEVSEEPGGPD
jgi:tRNA(Ile)-lysidine synthase